MFVLGRASVPSSLVVLAKKSEMELTTLSIVLLVGLVLLIIVFSLVLLSQQRRHLRDLTFVKDKSFGEKEDLKDRFSREKDALVSDYERQKDALQDRITALSGEVSSLRSTLASREEYEKKMEEDHRKDYEKRDERYKEQLSEMRTAFENMASKTSEMLREKNATSMTEVLAPMQEKFKEFSESLKNSSDSSLKSHTQLLQKISDLDQQSRTIGEEARNLADALTGYSKVQGDFGEMLLQDVLLNAGFTEGVHFVTQTVIQDEGGREIRSAEGKRMIPDVLVFYPDDTVVVVDSKVSLTAYYKYANAKTREEKDAYMKEHIASIEKHVLELSAKDYASFVPSGKKKVDYNIMFIPMEGPFEAMLSEAPTLWRKAKDRHVLIVSQMTLLVVLNMIQMSWRQFDQEKNIEQVYKTASELLGAIEGWLTAFAKVGTSLEAAQKSYQESRKKLSESSTSVVRKIEKLEKLGAAPRKRASAASLKQSRLGEKTTVIPADFKTEEAES